MARRWPRYMRFTAALGDIARCSAIKSIKIFHLRGQITGLIYIYLIRFSAKSALPDGSIPIFARSLTFDIFGQEGRFKKGCAAFGRHRTLRHLVSSHNMLPSLPGFTHI